MFKNLTDYGYQRNAKEAIGFYLAYLFLIIFSCGILGGLIGMITQSGDFSLGVRVGSILAVMAAIVLSFLILKEKKSLDNIGCILLAVISGVLAFLAGGLGGLIPVAYLTSKPAKAS
jgi:chromate transport protein ChrA